MSKDLNPLLIKTFYSFMEMEMQSYEIYIDTPENRFEYDPETIWFINPKTEKWMLQLEKSGKLWYYDKLYVNFSMWFKEELPVFQQLITMWVEDVLKRGVSTTPGPGLLPPWLALQRVEDVLKRGVSTTSQTPSLSPSAVEDVLKRGVSTTRNEGGGRTRRVEDVLKRGVSTTSPTMVGPMTAVEDVLKNRVSLNIISESIWFINPKIKRCLLVLEKIKEKFGR